MSLIGECKIIFLLLFQKRLGVTSAVCVPQMPPLGFGSGNLFIGGAKVKKTQTLTPWRRADPGVDRQARIPATLATQCAKASHGRSRPRRWRAWCRSIRTRAPIGPTGRGYRGFFAAASSLCPTAAVGCCRRRTFPR